MNRIRNHLQSILSLYSVCVCVSLTSQPLQYYKIRTRNTYSQVGCIIQTIKKQIKYAAVAVMGQDKEFQKGNTSHQAGQHTVLYPQLHPQPSIERMNRFILTRWPTRVHRIGSTQQDQLWQLRRILRREEGEVTKCFLRVSGPGLGVQVLTQ